MSSPPTSRGSETVIAKIDAEALLPPSVRGGFTASLGGQIGTAAGLVRFSQLPNQTAAALAAPACRFTFGGRTLGRGAEMPTVSLRTVDVPIEEVAGVLRDGLGPASRVEVKDARELAVRVGFFERASVETRYQSDETIVDARGVGVPVPLLMFTMRSVNSRGIARRCVEVIAERLGPPANGDLDGRARPAGGCRRVGGGDRPARNTRPRTRRPIPQGGGVPTRTTPTTSW